MGALCIGKWKLVSQTHDHWGHAKPGPWELYDTEADRTEMNDLSATMPEKVKEMQARYVAWSSRVGVVDNTVDWRKQKK